MTSIQLIKTTLRVLALIRVINICLNDVKFVPILSYNGYLGFRFTRVQLNSTLNIQRYRENKEI